MLHASHIKKLQPNFQSFLLNFKICNSIKKKTFSKKNQISFMTKKYRSASKEDTIQFCVLKNSNLYPRKTQICFVFEKKFRSASKEDTNLFLCFKNSNLYLRKIQIYFCVFKKIQICI